MKKYLPYTLAAVLIGALIMLFVTGNNSKEKQLDERVTLRRQDKIPYGTYVAYQGLTHIFPQARIYTSRQEPGYWDSLSSFESDQALVIIAGKFNADESEIKKLITFIEQGNDVFVSAGTISYSAADILGCRVNDYDNIYDTEENQRLRIKDSLYVYLNPPPFGKQTKFVYPGKRLDAYFAQVDEKTTEVLGEDQLGRPNFIRLQAGKGNLYIHLAPMAFTNYFLLHKENIRYYEKALSVINPATRKVVWDEYYLNKKYMNDNEDKKNWFSVLSRYPALKAALLTAIFSLLVYVLLEMRRKQRYIPVVKKPTNDSMDFVKTIGRMYFDKGDHKNLCRKMGSYFLEHVRNRYKLLTGTLDEEFIKKLQYKSGAEEQEVREIVSFIKYVEDGPAISHKQLTQFHSQLESFYKKA
ncbi:MAG: DUF4350 domain-containing protein [Bacteroidota bacterium]|nr:DUF4350 domain-containing protein [Bacteroidota bacterium]